jgi:hypothetical protein
MQQENGEMKFFVFFQKDDDSINFRHSLEVLVMRRCKLDERDLERLRYEIRPCFSTLHTIDIKYNGIRSLRGIEDRTKQIMTSSSSNNLRKLNLQEYPVYNHAIVRDDVDGDSNDDDDDTVTPNDKARDPKEKIGPF